MELSREALLLKQAVYNRVRQASIRHEFLNAPRLAELYGKQFSYIDRTIQSLGNNNNLSNVNVIRVVHQHAEDFRDAVQNFEITEANIDTELPKYAGTFAAVASDALQRLNPGVGIPREDSSYTMKRQYPFLEDLNIPEDDEIPMMKPILDKKQPTDRVFDEIPSSKPNPKKRQDRTQGKGVIPPPKPPIKFYDPASFKPEQMIIGLHSTEDKSRPTILPTRLTQIEEFQKKAKLLLSRRAPVTPPQDLFSQRFPPRPVDVNAIVEELEQKEADALLVSAAQMQEIVEDPNANPIPVAPNLNMNSNRRKPAITFEELMGNKISNINNDMLSDFVRKFVRRNNANVWNKVNVELENNVVLTDRAKKKEAFETMEALGALSNFNGDAADFMYNEITDFANSFAADAGWTSLPQRLDLTNSLKVATSMTYLLLSPQGYNLIKRVESVFQPNRAGETTSILGKVNTKLVTTDMAGATRLYLSVQKQIFNEIREVIPSSKKYDQRGAAIGAKLLTLFYQHTWDDMGSDQEWATLNFVSFVPSSTLSFSHLRRAVVDQALLITSLNATNLTKSMEELIKSAVSPDLFLVIIVIVTTILGAVMIEDDSDTTCIDMLMSAGYRDKGQRNKYYVRQGTRMSEFMLMIESIAKTVLPRVIMELNKMLLYESITSTNSNNITKWVASSGLRLREYGDDYVSADGLKVALEDITFNRGHTNTGSWNFNLSSTSIANHYRTMKNLRFINYAVVPTPHLSFNMSSIFKEFCFDEDSCKLAKQLLTEYLSQYLAGIIKTIPTDMGIASVAIRPMFQILMDGELLVNLVEVGSCEILSRQINAFPHYKSTAEKISKMDDIVIPLLSIAKPQIAQYIELISDLGDKINDASMDSNFASSIDSKITEWIEDVKAKTNASLTDNFSNLVTNGHLREIEREEISLASIEKEAVHGVESSADSFYVIALIAKIKKAHDDVASKKLRDPNHKTVLKFRCVPQWKFYVNLIHDQFIVSPESEKFVSNIREYGQSVSDFIRHTDSSKIISDILSDIAIRENIGDISGYSTLPIEELFDKEAFAKRDTDINAFSGRFKRETYNKMIDYKLFSNKVNDAISISNTAYVKSERGLFVRTEYFSSIGVPCAFKALWFFIYFNMFFNKEVVSNKREQVELLHEKICDQVASLNNNKRCLKKILCSIKDLNNSRGFVDDEWIDEGFDKLDSICYSLLEDVKDNSDLTIEPHETIWGTNDDFNTIAITNEFVPSSESQDQSIVLNVERLMINDYTLANEYVNRFQGQNISSLEANYIENKVIYTCVSETLKSAVSESFMDFCNTLKNIIMTFRQLSREERGFINESVIYIVETKTFMFLDSPGIWQKCGIVRLNTLFDLLRENPNNTSPRIDYVFYVKQNHVTILTLAQSFDFLKYKALKVQNNQVSEFTLGTKKPISESDIAKTCNKVRAVYRELQATSINSDYDHMVVPESKLFGAWDIESAIEPVTGRQIPMVLSLVLFDNKRFVRSSVAPANSIEERIRESIVFVKTFRGEDCVDKFITYLNHRFFHNKSRMFSRQSSITLYTYNGARYDHPLIIKKLMALSPEIIGSGLNDPKNIAIKRDSSTTKVYFKNKIDDMEIIFSDFCCLHPTGRLIDTCKVLLPHCPKLWKQADFDIASKPISFFNEHMDEIVSYCEQDVISLMGCVLINTVNFNKLLCEIMRTDHYGAFNNAPTQAQRENTARAPLPNSFHLETMISASQWATKIFSSFFLHTELKGETSDAAINIINKTFYGGMTSVFIKGWVRSPGDNPLYYYDINSSYPNAMCGDMPFSRYKENPTPIQLDQSTDIKNIDRFSIYHVVKMKFKTDFNGYTYNPQKIFPFPIKSHLKRGKNWGAIYPETIEDRWMYGDEILRYRQIISTVLPYSEENIALDDLMEFQIDQVLEPELNSIDVPESQRHFFRNYINFFYKKKTECKQDPSLSALEPLFKLFLNSLFGKFGQREFPNTSYCYGTGNLDNMAYDPNIVTAQKCGMQPDQELSVYKIATEKGYKTIGSLKRMASWITAQARLNLWEAIITVQNTIKPNGSRGRVYYCDTDSIFCDVELPARFKHQSQLGKWKLEDTFKEYCRLHKVNIDDYSALSIDFAFFLAPKCYGLFCRHNKEDSEMVTELYKLINCVKIKGVKKAALTSERFMHLVVNKHLSIEQLQFRRAFGQVFVDDKFHKEIKLRIQKRVYDENGSRAFADINEFEEHIKQELNS